MRKGLVLALLVSLVAIGMTLPAFAAEKGLAKADKAFVRSAAGGGLMDVEMGQLAATRAASQDVKDFGNMMVPDHGKANDELKTLAATKEVKLPAKLGVKQKGKVDKFSKLSGDEFDKKYMEQMVKDHVRDVAKFKKASNTVKDPEVNAWASKTLSTLEQHLQKAKEVAQKVGAKVK